MEQGNPEWACAPDPKPRSPKPRSPRRQSPPQLSECGLGEVPRMDWNLTVDRRNPELELH